MYWLAINREPVLLEEMKEDFVYPISTSELLQAIVSLQRSSLIEKIANGFTQQPVVMEYVTERIIEQVCEEFTTEDVKLLMSHALLKATANDYIRESQICVILEPISERLSLIFSSKKNVENKFN